MPNLSTHNPITFYETISGNTELTFNPPQASGQTFRRGSPIQLVAGFGQQWDGNTSVPEIYGISLEGGSNYATAGQGYAANFGQIGFPGSLFSEGAAPNQPQSVQIPYGSPFVTGGVLTTLAVQDTLFMGQTDTSEPQTTITAGVVSAGSVLTATAANVHYVGELVVLSGFTGAGLPLNGVTATVLTVPSGASYTAQLPTTIGAIGATGAGVDNPGPVTPTIANVGQQFGLTADANGWWYIDFNKRTPGTNTALSIVSLYAGDVLQSNAFTESPNGILVFQFLQSVVSI